MHRCRETVLGADVEEHLGVRSAVEGELPVAAASPDASFQALGWVACLKGVGIELPGPARTAPERDRASARVPVSLNASVRSDSGACKARVCPRLFRQGNLSLMSGG